MTSFCNHSALKVGHRPSTIVSLNRFTNKKIIMNEENQIEPYDPYIKGRGAQFNTRNKFLKNEIVKEHIEGIDDWIEPNVQTQYLEDNAKGIVNKVESPDV